MKHKLLIVDDELANLRLLERLFSRDFHCLTASSGAEAIRLLEQHEVAILISDQRMPIMTGIELLKQTAKLRPHMVRILLTGYTDVEALVEAINCGLVYMYISKPWNNDELKLKVGRACEHYESSRKSYALAFANERLLDSLKEIRLHIVTALTEMLRTRDEYAYHQALRIRHYAITIGGKLGLGEEDLEDLAAAAQLHDLGHIDFASNSLSRSRRSDQSTIARAQSECEARLLAAIPELQKLADIVKFHRESFDGTGFPAGLKSDQIPLACRILRVADEYDQMIQPKEQTASMTHDEAMGFLMQRSGKQFDPNVIEIMAQLTPSELDGPYSSGGTGEVRSAA